MDRKIVLSFDNGADLEPIRILARRDDRALKEQIHHLIRVGLRAEAGGERQEIARQIAGLMEGNAND